MKISVRNLAKIESADIELNGITLIVGANDAGKSTCGKAVCALANAFTQMEMRGRRILSERISKLAEKVLNAHLFLFGEDCVDAFIDEKLNAEDMATKMIERTHRYGRSQDVDAETKKELVARLEELRALDSHVVECEAVQRCFDSAFNGQYLPLVKGVRAATTISVLTEGDAVGLALTLKRNSCEFKSLDGFKCNAWLLADPSVVSDLGEHRMIRCRDQFEWALVSAINESRHVSKVDPVAGAFDAAMQKNKWQKIATCLANTHVTDISFDKAKGYVIRKKEFSDPLLIDNASMGVKAIALLQILGSSGLLKEDDILVLDEPEVHLHPAWQIVYAEAIVLIAKELGVKVLLTTHSPDFIQAIRLFSTKHEVQDSLTAYLTLGENRTTMDKVSLKNWDKVFDRFASAVRTLQDLSDLLQEKK